MMVDSLVHRLMELADDFAEEAKSDVSEYRFLGGEGWSRATLDKRSALESALRSAIGMDDTP